MIVKIKLIAFKCRNIYKKTTNPQILDYLESHVFESMCEGNRSHEAVDQAFEVKD